MKILFVTNRDNDYIAATLWDGLCEVNGTWTTIVTSPVWSPNMECVGGIKPRFPDQEYCDSSQLKEDSKDFDLMVLNACFLRDHDWSWFNALRPRLKPNTKIVYIEGWDSAHEVHEPPFRVDAVFRRELDPDFSYPYKCEPLGFGAPERWFKLPRKRPWDVFCAPTVHADSIRWDVLSKVFQTKQRHRSLVANPPSGTVCHVDYLGLMRQSKLCICPTGGAKCDCLRTYEAAACGCIPIFVGYQPWRREPWFVEPVHCFHCNSADELPAKIDYALSQDLEGMSLSLMGYAQACHTTRFRAMTLLKAVGMV